MGGSAFVRGLSSADLARAVGGVAGGSEVHGLSIDGDLCGGGEYFKR